MAISPDGTKIVFAAEADGRLQLWLRSLDSDASRPLAGTNNAVLPFWAPDSRSIAFFADGQLKRIDIDGGTTRTLARAALGVGGSWSGDGTILFGPIFSGPLYRMSSDGGEPTAVTRLAPGQPYHWLPRFLPDNRHFMFAVPGDGIYLGDLVGSEPRRLLDAQYAELHMPSGRLLFLRQGTVFSQPFDTSSMILTGTAVPVADQAVALSVSSAGPIVYRRPPALGRHQFIWFDRTGKQLAHVGEPIGEQGDPDLSPDGRYVALFRLADGNADSWILDTLRGVFTRFTFEPAANYSPRWSPDGKRIVFNSNKSGVYDLYIKSAIGDGPEELLLSTPQNKSATDWSPDGRYLLFRSVDPDTGHDLWAMEVDGDRKPFPVVRTSFVEAYGQFSPDGKWIAYQSNESGRFEIYAQPFPGPGPKQQVSKNGGAQIRWKSDGSELYYIDPDSQLMTVPIRSSTGILDMGDATTLFTVRIGEIVPLQSGYRLAYVVAPDGRFLVSTELEKSLPSPMTVILNWRAPR
jgi:Tol biopolymer transport system component